MVDVALPAPQPEGFDSDVLRRGLLSRFAVVGALLRSPASIAKDIAAERNLGGYVSGLLFASVLFSVAYGAVVGLFQPGWQTVFAAAKLPLVVVGTAALCTPTFYVFNALLGSRLTLRQSIAIVLVMTTSATLILAAFTPIAGLFTVSSGGRGFLVFLHVAIFVVAAFNAMRMIETTRTLLATVTGDRDALRRSFLAPWVLLLLVTGLQMAYSFRPFLLAGPFHTGQRGLFTDVLSDDPRK